MLDQATLLDLIEGDLVMFLPRGRKESTMETIFRLGLMGGD